MPANGHTESEEVDAVKVFRTGVSTIRISSTRIDDLRTLFLKVRPRGSRLERVASHTTNPARKAAREKRARRRGSSRCLYRRMNIDENTEITEICWEIAQAWSAIDQYS